MTAANNIAQSLDLLEPLCYQPPHLGLPSGNQSHTAIIDAFRTLFVQTSFLPVCQNESGEDDPSIFALTKCQRVRGSDEDDDGLDYKPIIITSSQLDDALNFASDSSMVIWEGVVSYGAVVVGMLAPNESDITIHVLGLDEWKHAVASDAAAHTAIAQTVQVHPCGNVDATRWKEVSSALHTALTDTQKDVKGGYHKEMGHQKSPSFVTHAVQCAILAVRQGESKPSMTTKPPGGYSDAGMHCNDVPRHTIVPLLMEIVHVYLQHNTRQNKTRIKLVMEAAMATRFLSARADFPNISKGGDVQGGQDSVWYKSVLFMIQVVTSKHIALEDCGKLALDCGLTTLLQITKTARLKIDAHANAARDTLVESPDFNITVPIDSELCSRPCEPLPARFDVEWLANTSKLSSARNIPQHNTPSSLPADATLHDALEWLVDIQTRIKKLGANVAVRVNSEVGMSLLLLGVKSIEGFIYQLVIRSLTPGHTVCDNSSTNTSTVVKLRSLLHQYKIAATELRTITPVQSYTTLLHSRMVLCVLAATCIADVALVNEIPEAAHYGLLLDVTCVEGLSLDTADAHAAALSVAKYVSSRHSATPLFGDGTKYTIKTTQTFAERVARSDAGMCEFADNALKFMTAELELRSQDFTQRKEALVNVRRRLQEWKMDEPPTRVQVKRFNSTTGKQEEPWIGNHEHTTWAIRKSLLEGEERKANSPMGGLVLPCPRDDAGRYIFTFFCKTPEVVQLASALVAEAVSTLQLFLNSVLQGQPTMQTVIHSHVTTASKSRIYTRTSCIPHCIKPDFGVFASIPALSVTVPGTLDNFSSHMTAVFYPTVSAITQRVSQLNTTLFVTMKQPVTTKVADQALLPIDSPLQWLVDIERSISIGSKWVYPTAV